MKKNEKKMSHAQIIALGFFIVILSGTVLLTLPISSRTGEWTNPINAMFTATSSTCVTGLIVADTYTHWNLFGQIVIISMIQIGGLGFITIGVLFSMFFKRRIGLERRYLIQESISAMQLSGVVKLVRSLVKRTFIIEGIGAVILSIRFIQKLHVGLLEGIYYGIFHSISAFCNAGFDLMGKYEQYSSITFFRDDIVVNLTISALIIIGGIGFIVWEEIKNNTYHWKRYSLHAKMVFIMTFLLVFGGMGLYAIFEWNNLFAGYNTYQKLISSFFASVTTRTAGFNTTDLGGLSQASKILTDILMFIGGCPGSTAGGVKTTSILVMVVYIWSNLRNSSGCNIMGRRISDEDIKKSSMVIGLNLILAIAALVIISAVQVLPLDDLSLEVFSAIGTVGLSTGLTRQLTVISKLVIIFLMFCGRIGSMTFALMFAYKKKTAPVQYPMERINVG